MNEIALDQQRTIDRIALTGSLIAFLAAAAFVALDPVQTVTRRASAPAAATAEPTWAVAAASAPARSPLVRLDLPSPAWTVATDGRWAAYARLEKGGPAEIVVRSLTDDDWRVAYRAAPGDYLGQLALAKGVLVFEEIAPSEPGRVSVTALDVATGRRTKVDSYVPLGVRFGEGGGYISSSPVTDGARVVWIHQTLMPAGGVCNEIRVLDLATGKSRMAFQKMATISGLALWREALAFTVATKDKTAAYTLDLSSGAAAAVDGFDFAYVQSLGSAGLVVTGGGLQGSSASWLIRADGSRTRVASDCFNVTVTDRVLAMRCGSQIEVRDLSTGTSLYSVAADAGALAVYETGVVWGQGDQLVLYALPPLAPAQLPRAD